LLKSLALKGRRFETWEEVGRAVAEAMAYRDQHRHPASGAADAVADHDVGRAVPEWRRLAG
jgi:hypothetical protein